MGVFAVIAIFVFLYGVASGSGKTMLIAGLMFGIGVAGDTMSHGFCR